MLGVFFVVNKSWQSQSDEESTQEVRLLDYEDQDYNFNLKYPEDLVRVKITEEDKKNSIILRLLRINPPMLVNIWKETGLGMVDMLIKKPLLEYLKTNLDKRYPAEFNDFKKEKIEDTKVAGLDAFTVWFTFQDKEKDYREKIKVFVFVKDKSAYYLNCMTPDVQWQYAEPSCDIIKNNFSFIEKTE